MQIGDAQITQLSITKCGAIITSILVTGIQVNFFKKGWLCIYNRSMHNFTINFDSVSIDIWIVSCLYDFIVIFFIESIIEIIDMVTISSADWWSYMEVTIFVNK